MAVKIKSGSTQVVANIADETFIVAANVVVNVTDDVAISAVDALGDGVGGRLFKIDGTVISGDEALNIENNPAEKQDRVIVDKTGIILSSTEAAITAGGDEGRVTFINAGQIDGNDAGIESSLKRTVIENSGTIAARGAGTPTAIAVTTSGSEGQLIIDNTGRIRGNEVGIGSFAQYDIANAGTIESEGFGIFVDSGAGSIVNTGIIRASVAIFANEGADDDGRHVITNRGKIFGEIDLSGSQSDDQIDVNGGKVFGSIAAGDGVDRILIRKGALVTDIVDGGDGDDTYIVDSSSFSIDETTSDGTDTVRSSASFSLLTTVNIENLTLTGKADFSATGSFDDNSLTGNAGDNALSGLRGDDTLDGGKGKDVLGLGEGIDTIIFRTGDGKDTVNDFTAEDFLDLSDLKAITSFDDLIDNHAKEVGANLVIKAGADEIKLLGLTLEDIAEGQFLF